MRVTKEKKREKSWTKLLHNIFFIENCSNIYFDFNNYNCFWVDQWKKKRISGEEEAKNAKIY